jgi:hypothetical protein
MRKFKLSRWRGVWIAVVISVLAVFTLNINNAHALLTGARALHTVWRFEREVLRTTRVGQYYEGLLFKHAQEVEELLSKDPANTKKKFLALGEETIPLLDAYLSGEGDSAIITAESMDALKDILDDLNVAGSRSLQKDIQAEYERFPLDGFVGMSMNEAYDYVLASFAGVLESPMLVEGTDGKWAYYIHKGVYFEYPSNWYVQVVEPKEENENPIVIIPSSENPSQWDAEWVAVGVATNVSPESASTQNFSFNTTGYEILWQESIQLGETNRVEYAARYKMAGAVIAEFYNPEKRIFIDAGVVLFDPLGVQLDDSQGVAKERYEYLFHLIESIKIVEP